MKEPLQRAKRAPLRDRFNYWFDNRLTKGSLGLIRILIIASLLVALIIAGLIILFGFHGDEEPASVFWDSIATIINAWMPSYGDGSPGYIVLMAVSAIAGVLFTSVLIGIVTSAIEEKIVDLKKGNSKVLESGHTVILGFRDGEYALLEQLILAAAGKPDCVVVAEDMDREEMEQAIRSNLDVPKNFRIICRTADILDPVALEACAIESCRAVVITPTDDVRAVKALLAVSALEQNAGCAPVRVSAILSGGAYRLPLSLEEKHNITALHTNDTVAKIIAHSCTQRGLAETFREVFNFEGDEFYLTALPEAAGLTFSELSLRMDRAVPLGACRGGQILLNPPQDFRFESGDTVLVFCEEPDFIRLCAPAALPEDIEALTLRREEETETLILGCNASLPVILRELPENVTRVVLAGAEDARWPRDAIAEAAAARGLQVVYEEGRCDDEETLTALAKRAEHIVILNDHEKEDEEADMEAVLLLIFLRDIRARYALRFNITTELRREQNQNLVADGDQTDFVVATSMSSLFLAQLAEGPELKGVFRELLSNEGSELFLKNPAVADSSRTTSVRALRAALASQSYLFLGYVDTEGVSHFNPPLDAELSLTQDDSLIVLGES